MPAPAPCMLAVLPVRNTAKSMSLVRFDKVSLNFAEQLILREANMAIEPGERVCLIGRNGAGKSTTFKLIQGDIDPDSGDIVRQNGLVVSQLAQTLPDQGDQIVRDVVKSGLSGILALLDEYRQRSREVQDPAGMHRLEELHRQIDAHGGWRIEQLIDATISELGLPLEKKLRELSGGWQRRVALARALVQKPDLLLLDEPTNHLDIVTIEWLERVVRSYEGSVLFITHDRAFLRRLATRILEIDRGRLTSWPGDFDKYLKHKDEFLDAESRTNARFDKKLDEEEAWIRQGLKARRTRNEGRVRALERMREERAGRLTPERGARIYIDEAEQSGRKVIRAKNVNYGFDGQPLIRDFSTKIMRGDRIGILGNNGVGKTTLLRLLLGEIGTQSGTIKHGTNLEVGYFDQMRESLDEEKSVADNVGGGRTYIKLNGKDRHIVGYLKGFLFSHKRATTKVKALSGGERNRLILAKLFTRAANLLVLDEPTNDLDMETLEVLEQCLADFSGTLIVVSHDREFLDNVVTSTIVFEDNGEIREYVGGYSDWLRKGKTLAEVDDPADKAEMVAAKKNDAASSRPKKLSFNEQRELDLLPEEIERLEAQADALLTQISTADFYSRDYGETAPVLKEYADTQEALDLAMHRWTELEDQQQRYRETRR